jgi:hypothetical protein
MKSQCCVYWSTVLVLITATTKAAAGYIYTTMCGGRSASLTNLAIVTT